MPLIRLVQGTRQPTTARGRVSPRDPRLIRRQCRGYRAGVHEPHGVQIFGVAPTKYLAKRHIPPRPSQAWASSGHCRKCSGVGSEGQPSRPAASDSQRIPKTDPLRIWRKATRRAQLSGPGEGADSSPRWRELRTPANSTRLGRGGRCRRGEVRAPVCDGICPRPCRRRLKTRPLRRFGLRIGRRPQSMVELRS